MSQLSTGFAGNVLKLASGSIFAQVLGVLVAPVVTRLFAPEAFGVATLFTSITGIIGVIACLRYDSAIMLPEKEEEAANLFVLSLLSVVVVTAFMGTILLLRGRELTDIFNVPSLARYIWLIPLAVFTGGIFTALNAWNTRTKFFGRLSIARVLSSLTTQSTKLTAGFAGFVSGGVLIMTTLAGQVVADLLLGLHVVRDDFPLFKRSVRFGSLCSGMRRHKKFPLYSSWSLLLNAASQQLPVWFLAYFFSSSVVGFYALGRLVLSVPMVFIGNAIAQVFYQRASEARSAGERIDIIVEQVFTRLVSLSMFPVLLLAFIGKECFIVFFGVQWAEAGLYFQILSAWIFLVFIVSPLSTLFFVFEKQKLGLVFDGILFLTRAVSLIIGGVMGNVYMALGLFSFTGVLVLMCMSFFILSFAGAHRVKMVKTVVIRGTYAIFPLTAILALESYFHLTPLATVLWGCTGTVAYYVILIVQDEQLRGQLQPLIQRCVLKR